MRRRASYSRESAGRTWLNCATLLTVTAQPSRLALRPMRSAVSMAVPVTEAWRTRNARLSSGSGSFMAMAGRGGAARRGWAEESCAGARRVGEGAQVRLHWSGGVLAQLEAVDGRSEADEARRFASLSGLSRPLSRTQLGAPAGQLAHVSNLVRHLSPSSCALARCRQPASPPLAILISRRLAPTTHPLDDDTDSTSLISDAVCELHEPVDLCTRQQSGAFASALQSPRLQAPSRSGQRRWPPRVVEAGVWAADAQKEACRAGGWRAVELADADLSSPHPLAAVTMLCSARACTFSEMCVRECGFVLRP